MAIANMPLVAPSKITETVGATSATEQNITVADISFFPTNVPNYATLGRDNDAEVVLYSGVDTGASQLTGCVRGQSMSVAKMWPAGTQVYHGLAAELVNNIITETIALYNAMEAAQTDITQNTADIATVNGVVSSLGSAVSDNTDDITALESRVDTAEGQISSSDGKITTLQNETLTGATLGGTAMPVSARVVAFPAYPTSLPASDVPPWAKQPAKPTYTASEVGLGNVANLAPADLGISTATQNALNGITSTMVTSAKLGGAQVTKTGNELEFPAYPTSLPASDVPTWAKQPTKPTYTAAEVGLGGFAGYTPATLPLSTATINAMALKGDKAKTVKNYTLAASGWAQSGDRWQYTITETTVTLFIEGWDPELSYNTLLVGELTGGSQLTPESSETGTLYIWCANQPTDNISVNIRMIPSDEAVIS